jgi:hypothetical protein
VIRYGVAVNYLPLEFEDPEGKPTDFDIDLPTLSNGIIFTLHGTTVAFTATVPGIL